MTTAILPASAARPQGRTIRLLALACIIAGVTGVLSGLFLAVISPAVDDSRYSYPLKPSAFVASQLWFAVHHLGLVAGAVALARTNSVSARRSGRIGARAAIAGLVLLAATEVAAAFAADFAYEGAYTVTLDASYGVASTLSGAGLIAAGIAAARDRGWQGPWRYVPLATGVFVFVPMTPLMMVGFTAARIGITGWMLMFVLLGLSFLRQERSDPVNRSH